MRIAPIDPHKSPLPPSQTAQFNALAASLSPEHTAWLLGYLQGSQQSQEAGQPSPPASANGNDGLTVLFASQTGNAMKVANQVAAAAATRGLRAVTSSAADYKTSSLRNERNLILVTSTQGEGDPPDSAVEFRRFLFGKRAPTLEGLHFAVLALGDYSYANFCKAGEDFDRRLEELGGKRVLARVDCDVEYQATAEAWQAQVLEAFQALAGQTEGPVTAALPTAGPGPSGPLWDKSHPFAAPVIERIDLNGRGSAKKTMHIELSLTGSGLTYEPGDALGVVPRNSPAYVDELLAAARLPGDAQVVVDGKESQLAPALAEAFEITTITRPFVKAYASQCKWPELAGLLEKGREGDLRDYVYGREIIDLVLAYPPRELSPQAWVGMLRRLQPRLYSIASSLRAHEEEVHLLVGLTRYQSHGRQREGVCSGFLSERLEEDEPVRVYVSPNPNFRLPQNPDTRIIMIGPGTGVAPFRAFVEEREALGCRGRNWLFFGDQHFDTDFLYQVEWQRWHKSGVLSHLDLAFSRDQADKVYVQQRMLERSQDLYAWLQEGAYIYVCGDAGRMAADVDAALIAVVSKESGKGGEAAQEYVQTLQSGKRYQRDVY
jgi:sulfite reductase (NADPH) flavoprotein alpha-component